MERHQRRVLRRDVSSHFSVLNLSYAFIERLALLRHVARTGDIKDLVITEESGIAKGIRRIIAVTGVEAREASKLAISLSQELEHANRKNGKEKDTALKAFSVVSLYQWNYHPS